MNEIMNVMKERRSIRKFKPDMPSKEDLNQIIEAGLYAANGMGQQATVRSAAGRKDLILFMALRRSLLCWRTRAGQPMCMMEALLWEI